MKQFYEAPKIADERSLEVPALGCNKIPGLGDPSFCGPVWIGKHGVAHPGCSMNANTRSS